MNRLSSSFIRSIKQNQRSLEINSFTDKNNTYGINYAQKINFLQFKKIQYQSSYSAHAQSMSNVSI